MVGTHITTMVTHNSISGQVFTTYYNEIINNYL